MARTTTSPPRDDQLFIPRDLGEALRLALSRERNRQRKRASRARQRERQLAQAAQEQLSGRERVNA